METKGRQIRATLPLAVFERITRAADALGVSVNDLGARCVVAGLDDAIESRITELERMLVALRGEVEPSAEPANGTASPSPKQGRAEKAAAIKKAELDAARRRRPGSA